MSRFDYFVVFAEMRTGSNFLESNINAFDGLSCHGEAFNPHFIGYPKATDILGVTQADRESDPQSLISAVKSAQPGLHGFRFFNNHDPRVLDGVLEDARCAKVILTRNPIESYVSWKIAKATGQWKLTNVKHAKTDKVSFDPAEFETHLTDLQNFQVHLLNQMQRRGQTAFYVAYEDLQDVSVMNGLAEWLGCDARLEQLDQKLKKQNPSSMSDKVVNFDEMASTLARLDQFNLSRTPNFEPRRGPAVPSYVAAAHEPLLFLPLRSGPEQVIRDWMTALDGGGELVEGFNQKTLRQWKRRHPGHRSFTVLRHPLARAHAAFCEKILSTESGSFSEIRDSLRKDFKLPLGKGPAGDEYDSKTHREAMLGFLKFLKANLSGQTGIRVDAHWASQSSILSGIGQFGTPDMVLREDTLQRDLNLLGQQIGQDSVPDIAIATDPHYGALEAIYDDELEAAARDVYPRDYMMFGFGDWQAA